MSAEAAESGGNRVATELLIALQTNQFPQAFDALCAKHGLRNSTLIIRVAHALTDALEPRRSRRRKSSGVCRTLVPMAHELARRAQSGETDAECLLQLLCHVQHLVRARGDGAGDVEQAKLARAFGGVIGGVMECQKLNMPVTHETIDKLCALIPTVFRGEGISETDARRAVLVFTDNNPLQVIDIARHCTLRVADVRS